MKYILNKNNLKVRKCYICFDSCDEIHCNCELQNVHQKCINSLIKNNIKSNCPSCNQEYEISLYLKIFCFLQNFIYYLYDIFNNITEYDIFNGRRWDDE